MILLVPFFGETARFRPLLDKWFDAYRAARLDPHFLQPVLLTDDEGLHGATAAAKEQRALGTETGVEAPDVSGFADLIRPGQPFDVKGALVCVYLLEHEYPTLLLDADALLVRDPRQALLPFAETAVSMPRDAGALVYFRRPKLEEPYSQVRKMCAGVMFFGYGPAGRSRLVAGYRRAFEEMRETIPWRPHLPHLLEQYSWAVVNHRRGGGTLPHTLNWSARHLGDSAEAVILHDYGHLKWDGEKRPANT